MRANVSAIACESAGQVHSSALATTFTSRSPAGTVAPCAPTAARRRRRTRLRCTAVPTVFGMAYATQTSSPGAQVTLIGPLRARVRARCSARNRRGPCTRPTRRSRLDGGLLGSWCAPDNVRLLRRAASSQADSLERPLARRALRIARPPAVAIRARKPCFFERRRLFGWNVRFTTRTFRSPHRRRQMNLSRIGARRTLLGQRAKDVSGEAQTDNQPLLAGSTNGERVVAFRPLSPAQSFPHLPPLAPFRGHTYT